MASCELIFTTFRFPTSTQLGHVELALKMNEWCEFNYIRDPYARCCVLINCKELIKILVVLKIK